MFFDVLNHFRDDRKKIIIIAVVVILIVFFVKGINQNEHNKKGSSSVNTTTAFNENNSQNISYYQNIIDNDEINFDITSSEIAVKAFIAYCQYGKPEKAYELISNDCKRVLYSTYRLFYDDYYAKNFFNKSNNITIKKIDKIKEIFEITFKADLVATGGDESIKKSYISVVSQNNEFKIDLSKDMELDGVLEYYFSGN